MAADVWNISLQKSNIYTSWFTG